MRQWDWIFIWQCYHYNDFILFTLSCYFYWFNIFTLLWYSWACIVFFILSKLNTHDIVNTSISFIINLYNFLIYETTKVMCICLTEITCAIHSIIFLIFTGHSETNRSHTFFSRYNFFYIYWQFWNRCVMYIHICITK